MRKATPDRCGTDGHGVNRCGSDAARRGIRWDDEPCADAEMSKDNGERGLKELQARTADLLRERAVLQRRQLELERKLMANSAASHAESNASTGRAVPPVRRSAPEIAVAGSHIEFFLQPKRVRVCKSRLHELDFSCMMRDTHRVDGRAHLSAARARIAQAAHTTKSAADNAEYPAIERAMKARARCTPPSSTAAVSAAASAVTLSGGDVEGREVLKKEAAREINSKLLQFKSLAQAQEPQTPSTASECQQVAPKTPPPRKGRVPHTATQHSTRTPAAEEEEIASESQAEAAEIKAAEQAAAQHAAAESEAQAAGKRQHNAKQEQRALQHVVQALYRKTQHALDNWRDFLVSTLVE
jgi:colicin import membrane protein